MATSQGQATFKGAGNFIARPSTLYIPKAVTANLGRPPVTFIGSTPTKLEDAASAEFTKRLAQRVDDMLEGHLNTMLVVTLAAAGATTTTITDRRIGATSALHLMPTTAHAAAIAGSIYMTVGNGSVVLTHSANSNTDCTFNMTIVG